MYDERYAESRTAMVSIACRRINDYPTDQQRQSQVQRRHCFISCNRADVEPEDQLRRKVGLNIFYTEEMDYRR